MKKILFVSHEGSITGAPLFLVKLVRYLKIERPEYIIAIFFSKTGELVELLKKDGFDIFVSEKYVQSNSKTFKLLNRIKHYFFYIKVLVSFRPNLVYSNTIVNFGEVFLAKLFKASVLLHIHEGKNFCRTFRRRLMISCLLTNRIIVGSHYVNSALNSLTKRLGYVVHNGVNLPTKIPVKHKLSGIPFKIGILGTIDLNKGQLVAMEALRLLVGRGLSTKLHVAGRVVDEGYYAQLCNHIRENTLEEFVEFVGIVPDATVFLNSLDLLVVPSFDEAFPTVILEAFSTGTLVVASDVGGIPEIIQNEVNGLLVKAGDSMMLAEAIEKIIMDDSLLQRLPLSALKTLQEKFDVCTTNRLLTIHLDEILLGKSQQDG